MFWFPTPGGDVSYLARRISLHPVIGTGKLLAWLLELTFALDLLSTRDGDLIKLSRHSGRTPTSYIPGVGGRIVVPAGGSWFRRAAILESRGIGM
jgi:hypothetical protein